jgi:poly-gamma-glutamate synthesis protein (capsule biosynthesis protein)
LPAFLNKQAQPEALKQGDERFQKISDYMEWVSDQYPHAFEVDGDEILVRRQV